MKKNMVIYGPYELSEEDISRLAKSFGYEGRLFVREHRMERNLWNERQESIASAVGKFNALIPLTEWNSTTDPTIVGEYIASTVRNDSARRWWDGESWSFSWHKEQDSPSINRAAGARRPGRRPIFWRGLSEAPILLVKK